MKIVTSSPTRVDLAGGTLDCWPLYALIGDCHTVNLSINVFTGCELQTTKDSAVHIQIQDLAYEKIFLNSDEFLRSSDKELLLVREVLSYAMPESGFRLSTYSKSPIGGGLGGSSSLCISILKALLELHGKRLSTNQLVTLASNIEARILKTPTGTQDYFAAIEPGLNVIHYTSEGPKLEGLKVDLSGLQENLMLVYTGRPHHSGINNWQVIKSIMDGDKTTFAALKDIACVSAGMANACRQAQWQELPELFRAEFDARIRLSSSFSSPEIAALEKIVLGAGGDAVKICGAGGGGCVLVWASPHSQIRIEEQCLKSGFQPIKIQPVTGSVAR